MMAGTAVIAIASLIAGAVALFFAMMFGIASEQDDMDALPWLFGFSVVAAALSWALAVML